MAITSESQIIKMDSINNGLAHLDKAITKLLDAKSDLERIKQKCNPEVVNITGVDSPSVKINVSIDQINDLIADITAAKNSITSEATQVISKQKQEYADYKQKEKEKQEKKKKGDD